MRPSRRRPRFEFKSLSARIYVYAVLLLVVGTAVAIQVMPWVTRLFYADIYEGFSIWLTDEICAQAKDVSDLQRELDRAVPGLTMDATVRDLDGRIVASTADPPLEPIELAAGPRGVTFGGWDRIALRLPETSPVQGTIVWRREIPRTMFLFLLGVGSAIFALIGLGIIPLARSMATPLRELRDVARRFGGGALKARAESTRADEIGDLARSFNEMATRIEASRRAEHELLAGISHEIRTPLARMRVAIDLVSEGDPASAAAHLPGLQNDLREVERLLEDVLTAARLDLAMPEDAFPGLQKDVVLASELASVVARRFEANHPTRTLDLEVSNLNETALDVDATLLGRALQNLLDNAAKYSSGPLRLEVAALAERVTFRVIDRGMGMSEADLALVFTPFFRGDPSRTRETGGVGLGLALARRIARAHGGDVAIESRLGEGTTVTMELPVLGI